MNDLDPDRLRAQLESFSEGPKHAPGRIDALIELAWALALADPDEARVLTEQARQLAEASDYTRGRALEKRNRAYLVLLGGELKDALRIGLEALEELEALGELDGKATSLDVLFHCYERIGDFKSALKVNLQNLEINRTLGHKRGEAWALHNMGSINVEMGESEGAIGYYDQSLAIFQDINYPVGEGRVRSRLGLLLSAQGKHEEALLEQECSKALSQRLGLVLGVALADSDIGRAHEALGRIGLARKHYQEAIAGFDQQMNRASVAETLIHLGRLEGGEGNYELGGEHLRQAFDYLDGIGSKKIELTAHEAMAELCELRGDTVQALHHIKRQHALFKEVYDAESRSELRNLGIRMEMQQAAKDAEIHRLRYVELEGMQAQLLQAERMAAVGSLAAGLAHEVNNPLGVIKSSLDVTARAARVLTAALPPEIAEVKRTRAAAAAIHASVEASQQAGQRILELVRSLRRFVRLDESDYGSADLVEGLESALTLLAPSIPSTVQLIRDLKPLPPIACYASEVNQAFMTLLTNAVEAIEGAGTVSVRTRVEDGHALVEVADTGRGMDERQIAGLFELGFSGNRERVRFHIGLPTAAATVRKQGGSINVKSAPGDGTQFSLRFPISSGPATR